MTPPLSEGAAEGIDGGTTEIRRFRSAGVLYKWTNYVTGWQPRYFEVQHGCLVYFKTKAEKNAGCRGSLALKAAHVETHGFDDCEFAVRVNEATVWYLRAENNIERDRWVRRLTVDYADSDYSSSKSHSRNASVCSTPSEADGAKKVSMIAARAVELAAYRELCISQMAEIEEQLEKAGSLPRAQLLTMKATHIAMLSNVDQIIQLSTSTMEQPGVHKHPLPLSPIDSEVVDKKKNGEGSAKDPRELSKSAKKAPDLPSATPRHPVSTLEHPSPSSSSNGTVAKPDMVSCIGSDGDEEDWHDASERSSLSSIEKGVEARESRTSSAASSIKYVREAGDRVVAMVDRHLPYGSFDSVMLPLEEALHDEVEHLVNEQLDYAMTGAADPTMWTLFASDGEMKMYKREVELNGLPVDPLKALHSVKGVSALEYMHFFFDPKYKQAWDHTLESARLIEKVAPDTVVMHQKHKTIWPAAPRESLFWSHLRRVDEWKSPDAHDMYVVCNKDITRADVPLASSNAVRVGLTVAMICETIVSNPLKLPLAELPRDAFTCKIIYVSSVHPGGWVPTMALRNVYKREYPKFLRQFTAYVQQQLKNEKKVAI